MSSFLSDVLHAETGEAGPARSDDDAIKALAALSATNHISAQDATSAWSPDEKAIGRDASQLVPSSATTSTMDPTATAQNVAENREPSYTRHEPTTSQVRQAPENSAIASLKHEHSSRTQSPLRESSVPMSSTELATTTATAPPPKKKPAPKKGTASTIKKDSKPKKSKPESAGSAKSRPKSSVKNRIASASVASANSSPGPRSVRTASSPARSSPEADGEAEQAEEEEDEGTPDPDDELYCLCRRPDTGTFMIGCDGGCDDWFHGKCVGISEKDKGLIDRYMCPRCTEKGIGVTTWKRMCRREGCRSPAKLQEGSKYCSQACGMLFMQSQLAKARPSAPAAKNTKKSAQNSHDDLGARGGLLSVGELKAWLNAAPTLEQFMRLGDGVISTPPTPPKAEAPTTDASEDAAVASHESALNDIERERIEQISQQKQVARARHSLLKDRAKFITMLKQLATRLAEERNHKPKDVCGYDARITWTEDQFHAWRDSPEGQEALRTGVLNSPEVTDTDGDTTMNANTGEGIAESCTKRKCHKHYEWAKLALDDTRFETTANGEKMRALDKEEKEIKERAQLRAREIRAGGIGGTVEFHEMAHQEKTVNGEPVAVAEEDKTMQTLDAQQEILKTSTAVDEDKVMEAQETNEENILQAPAAHEDKITEMPDVAQVQTTDTTVVQEEQQQKQEHVPDVDMAEA